MIHKSLLSVNCNTRKLLIVWSLILFYFIPLKRGNIKFKQYKTGGQRESNSVLLLEVDTRTSVKNDIQ